MDAVMSALQVRTAIPFGYLFFALGWVVGMSALAVIMLRCIHHQKVVNFFGFFASLTGLCFGALIFVANTVLREQVEFNPLFSKIDLIGGWTNGSSGFELASKNEASFSLEPDLRKLLGILNGEGYWERTGDFDVNIGNQRMSQTTKLRVVRYRDELRIIIQDYPDLDMWDGDLGFGKSTN